MRIHSASAYLLATALVLFSGCASVPPPPLPTPPTRARQERIVITRVPYLVKESRHFLDGSVDYYRLFHWQDDGRVLVREELRDASANELLESVIYTYNEGRMIGRTVVDPQGRQKSRRAIVYNRQGLVETESSYDRRDTLQAVSRYQYDQAGRRIEWSTLDNSQAVLAVTRYEYLNDRLTTMTIRGAGGRTEAVIRIEYDSSGNRSLETVFDAMGRVEKITEYRYDGRNRLIEERTMDGSRVLTARTTYEYGEHDQPIRISHFDGRDVLKSFVTMEYAVREERKTVYE